MKKYTIAAAFAAACLAASASVRDSRSSFTMPHAGADHSVLRPASVKLPQGCPTADQRKANLQRRINTGGFTPDASMVASNWSLLENEDGSYWFFTQEFETVNDWYYGASDFTVYNDRLEKQATIHFDAPEGETCNSIQPFGMVTRKFFDINDSTWELLVYVHCITADYVGKNYVYVVNNNGEVLERYDGYSAQFLDYGSGFNAQRRLLVGGEDKRTGKYSVDVYKKAGWGSGATKEHTFEMATELTDFSDGPAVNSFCIDGEGYYTMNHYEKPYVSGYDSMGMPTVTADNNYVVEVFNSKFEPVATVKDPVKLIDNGYSMRTFGYFGYDDLNRSFNADGSNKLDLIITNAEYFFNAVEDTYFYGWSVYNEDAQKLNEFSGRAIDWWRLSSIKGQPEQTAIYMLDEEGGGHIEVYNLPSCELVAGFDDTVEGLPISTAFDRVPTAEGYDYITGINQGYGDDKGNVIGVVAWITPDGKLDKRVNFNLGPHAEYFTVALSPMTLNPYVFNTDDNIEYLYRVKTGRGDGSNVLDDVVVIADSEGRELHRFTSDNVYNSLSSCDVLYDAQGRPFFLIGYYASAYDDHYGETDLNIFDLPFTKWPQGGSGTEDEPYIITSAGDFMQMAADPTAHYVVANDIDFGYIANGWAPLPEFGGTLDGNNHVLQNFTVTADNDSYCTGLFSTLNGAKVSNLVFESPELSLTSVNNYAGVLTGFASANTDVQRVAVYNPRVSGPNYHGNFGTIAGYAGAYVNAIECFVSGADVDLPEAVDLGGIYGFATASGVASACSVEGRLNGQSSVGGIIGSSYIGSYAVNCHANVDLTAHHYVGGIVGDSEKRGTVDRCYAEGTVRATGTDKSGSAGAGGIIGYLEPYWGGESDNPVAAKQNLSAVKVEGAGAVLGAHRIAGNTINDYEWTPEEIAAGKNKREEGLVTNYATAPEAEGMEVGLNKVDGATIAAAEVTEAFLTKNLLFAFGNTIDAPWTFDGKPCLFTESYFTGIERVLADDNAAPQPASTGIYDLQGRHYEAITAPGVYVVNGKKVIVK